jgi:hypothetical protein
MSVRGSIPTLLFALSAVLFFGLGSFLAARLAAENENEQIAALRAELMSLKRQHREPTAAGTTGRTDSKPATMDDQIRAALVADIKRELKSEMGLLPLSMLRERRASFVEMYSYDSTGSSNYGTAGYLGHGYFITVKHGVIALGDVSESRRFTSVKWMYKGQALAARVVDNYRFSFILPLRAEMFRRDQGKNPGRLAVDRRNETRWRSACAGRPSNATRGRPKLQSKLQSPNAQTPSKIEEYQRPESKASQQLREPCEICKTSIPASNPGGASNHKN